MASQSSAKLLHLLPQQFEVLLQELESQTPPKTQTMFSLRQVVERLYEFIERSLAHHYSFDELAVIIHKSLVKLEDVGEVPEIKGETLKKYFLEVRREQESQTGKRKSQAGKGERSGAGKASLGTRGKAVERRVEAPIVPVASTSTESVTEPIAETKSAAKKLPTTRTAAIELAY